MENPAREPASGSFTALTYSFTIGPKEASPRWTDEGHHLVFDVDGMVKRFGECAEDVIARGDVPDLGSKIRVNFKTLDGKEWAIQDGSPPDPDGGLLIGTEHVFPKGKLDVERCVVFRRAFDLRISQYVAPIRSRNAKEIPPNVPLHSAEARDWLRARSKELGIVQQKVFESLHSATVTFIVTPAPYTNG